MVSFYCLGKITKLFDVQLLTATVEYRFGCGLFRKAFVLFGGGGRGEDEENNDRGRGSLGVFWEGPEAFEGPLKAQGFSKRFLFF